MPLGWSNLDTEMNGGNQMEEVVPEEFFHGVIVSNEGIIFAEDSPPGDVE